MESKKEARKYFGTFKIRALSKTEAALRVPSVLSGEYHVYSQSNGVIVAIPATLMERDIDYVF
jgi:hypothetical protein